MSVTTVQIVRARDKELVDAKLHADVGVGALAAA